MSILRVIDALHQLKNAMASAGLKSPIGLILDGQDELDCFTHKMAIELNLTWYDIPGTKATVLGVEIHGGLPGETPPDF